MEKLWQHRLAGIESAIAETRLLGIESIGEGILKCSEGNQWLPRHRVHRDKAGAIRGVQPATEEAATGRIHFETAGLVFPTVEDFHGLSVWEQVAFRWRKITKICVERFRIEARERPRVPRVELVSVFA